MTKQLARKQQSVTHETSMDFLELLTVKDAICTHFMIVDQTATVKDVKVNMSKLTFHTDSKHRTSWRRKVLMGMIPFDTLC